MNNCKCDKQTAGLCEECMRKQPISPIVDNFLQESLEKEEKKMKKKIIKKPMTFKLQTKNWNKLLRKDQDKALLFMFGVLTDLSRSREYGYDPEFFAQFP